MRLARFALLSVLAACPCSGPQRAHAQNATPPSVPSPTEPPKGFTEALVLWPAGAPLARGHAEADIARLYTFPAPGAGPHPA